MLQGSQCLSLTYQSLLRVSGFPLHIPPKTSSHFILFTIHLTFPTWNFKPHHKHNKQTAVCLLVLRHHFVTLTYTDTLGDTEGPAHEPPPAGVCYLESVGPARCLPCLLLVLSAPIPWGSLKGSPAAFLNYVRWRGHAESGRSGPWCSWSC